MDINLVAIQYKTQSEGTAQNLSLETFTPEANKKINLLI